VQSTALSHLLELFAARDTLRHGSSLRLFVSVDNHLIGTPAQRPRHATATPPRRRGGR
jgi:hypothetical protein